MRINLSHNKMAHTKKIWNKLNINLLYIINNNAVIEEDTLHPPIILQSISEDLVDVGNFNELPIEGTQSCTNRELYLSLIPEKRKTFEELLLDTEVALSWA